MKLLKRLAKYLAIPVIVGILIAGSAYGQVTQPNFFKRVGDNVTFLVSTWEFGSATERISKIWADSVDATSVVIGGAFEGALVVDDTSTEAFLVRKNGDTEDMFIVDTVNEKVIIGDASGNLTGEFGRTMTTFNGITPFFGYLGYNVFGDQDIVVGSADGGGGNLISAIIARKSSTDVGAVISVVDDAFGLGATVASLNTFEGLSMGDDTVDTLTQPTNRGLRIYSGDGAGGVRFNVQGSTGTMTLFDPVFYAFGTTGKIISQTPDSITGPRFGMTFENLNEIASDNGGGSPGVMPFLFNNGTDASIAGIIQDTNLNNLGIISAGYTVVAPSDLTGANDFVFAGVNFHPLTTNNDGFYAVGEYLTGNAMFIHINKTGIGSRHITIGGSAYDNTDPVASDASWVLIGGQRRIMSQGSDVSQPTLELDNNSANLTDILGSGSTWNIGTTGIFQPGSTAGDPLLTVDGQFAYNSATDRMKIRANGTQEELAYFSDVGSTSLQQAYDNGATITTSGALAVDITVPDTSNNIGLVVTQNDTTNDPTALRISNNGTGSAIDIGGSVNSNDITGDNFTLTYAGVLNNTGLDITKTADQTALKVTSSAATSHAVDFIKTAGAGRALSSTYSSASNENANTFTNTGTGSNLFLDQNGNGIALDIDSEATTTPQQRISLGQLFTGSLTSSAFVLNSSNAGTTGTLFYLEDNSTAGSGSPVIFIRGTGGTARQTMSIQSASSSGALAVSQSGSGVGLTTTQTGDNYAFQVESTAATTDGAYIHKQGGTGSALVVDNDNAGTGLEIQGSAVATPALLFSTNTSFTGTDANSSIVFRQTHLTGATGTVMYVSAAIAGGAANPVVKFEATNTVHDQPVLLLVQNGTGEALETQGHIQTTGSSPVLTSCGTGPSITGTDTAGNVAVGTGATGCVITFDLAYDVTPACTVTSQAGTVFSYTLSTTAITLTNVGDLSSSTVNYTCFGQ